MAPSWPQDEPQAVCARHLACDDGAVAGPGCTLRASTNHVSQYLLVANPGGPAPAWERGLRRQCGCRECGETDLAPSPFPVALAGWSPLVLLSFNKVAVVLLMAWGSLSWSRWSCPGALLLGRERWAGAGVSSGPGHCMPGRSREDPFLQWGHIPDGRSGPLCFGATAVSSLVRGWGWGQRTRASSVAWGPLAPGAGSRWASERSREERAPASQEILWPQGCVLWV